MASSELTGCVWQTQAADDAANGLGSTLLTEIPVGGALTSAALFIDLSSMQVRAGPALNPALRNYDLRLRGAGTLPMLKCSRDCTILALVARCRPYHAVRGQGCKEAGFTSPAVVGNGPDVTCERMTYTSCGLQC